MKLLLGVPLDLLRALGEAIRDIVNVSQRDLLTRPVQTDPFDDALLSKREAAGQSSVLEAEYKLLRSFCIQNASIQLPFSLQARLAERQSLAQSDVTLSSAQKQRIVSELAVSVYAVSAPELLDLSSSNALASLRKRSNLLAADLRSLEVLDVLVIGAGVHEQIFQNTLRSEGSPLDVLTIERSGTISETFFAAGARVNSNSSVRKEGINEMGLQAPLPGVGNINFFPLGLTQLSNSISSTGQPPLGSFAKVATLNRSCSSSDVLFGWEVVEINVAADRVSDRSLSLQAQPVLEISKLYTVRIRRVGSGEECSLTTRAVVDARGIGEPIFPSSLSFIDTNTIAQQIDDVVTQMRKDFYAAPSVESFPRLLHSKDFYSMTTALSARRLNPYQPFAGRKVAVIGAGDSGKTIMEFLTRTGPGEEAFTGGIINDGNAIPVWINQPSKTRSQYKQSSRARYEQLGNAFPLTAGELGQPAQPFIRPYKSRLTGVAASGTHLRLSLKDGTTLDDVAVVIFATGLRPDLSIYGTLLPQQQERQQVKLALDDTTIVERITATPLQRRDGSPYGITPIKKLIGQNVLWIGPGGGNFFTDADRASLRKLETRLPDGSRLDSPFGGIKENVVSIFALGPISETTARLVARDLRRDSIGRTQTLQAPEALSLRLQSGSVTELGVLASPTDAAADALIARIAQKDASTLENLILFRFIASLPKVRVEAPDSEFNLVFCASLNGPQTEGPRIAVKLKECTLEDGAKLEARLQADIIMQTALQFRLGGGTSVRAQEFNATLVFEASGDVVAQLCEKAVGAVRRSS